MGCRIGDTVTRNEGVAYLLDLELVPFNLALVAFSTWDIHPPLDSPLDFTGDPGVAWLGKK